MAQVTESMTCDFTVLRLGDGHIPDNTSPLGLLYLFQLGHGHSYQFHSLCCLTHLDVDDSLQKSLQFAHEWLLYSEASEYKLEVGAESVCV